MRGLKNLSRIITKEGSFLSMYQGGSSIMSRCRAAQEEKATKTKAPRPFSGGARRQTRHRLVFEKLAGDFGDARGLRKFVIGVRLNCFGGIEGLIVAPIILFVNSTSASLDHLTAAFEKCAGLDHQ